MSLEQAIHSRLAGDSTLTALVPAARIVTGLAQDDPVTPYLVLSRPQSQPLLFTSSRRVDEALLRLSVWSDELDLAKQAAAAVQNLLDRAGFTLSDDSLVRTRLAAHREEQQDCGRWLVEVEYRATVIQSVGA